MATIPKHNMAKQSIFMVSTSSQKIRGASSPTKRKSHSKSVTPRSSPRDVSAASEISIVSSQRTKYRELPPVSMVLSMTKTIIFAWEAV